jgi:hypothetical protein
VAIFPLATTGLNPMPKTPLTFDTVQEIALTLKDVQPGTAYGAAALKVNGNTLANVPVNKSAEPNCAVFHIDFDLRGSLIKSKPEIYYITDHYAGYPTVLVRLSNISRGELRDLLGLAWSFVSAKKPARTSKRKPKTLKPRPTKRLS